MTDLAQPLRRTLAERLHRQHAGTRRQQTSSDGTTKFLLRFADGRHIESVYIPDTPAQTFCISTQVGCAMGCAFCLTGKMGLVRNLTAGEIAGQVRVLAHETGLAGAAFNIVLMGMGEPLHNYDATMKALRILADERGPRPAGQAGHALDGRRGAGARAARGRAVHAEPGDLAARDHRRAAQPRSCRSTASTTCVELIEACRRFPVRKRRRITFEYVLLAGVNDTPEDARRLVRLLDGIKAKVNLLPLNEAAGHPRLEAELVAREPPSIVRSRRGVALPRIGWRRLPPRWWRRRAWCLPAARWRRWPRLYVTRVTVVRMDLLKIPLDTNVRMVGGPLDAGSVAKHGREGRVHPGAAAGRRPRRHPSAERRRPTSR